MADGRLADINDEKYPGRVLRAIQEGSAELDELVVAHSRIGYLVSQADGAYEDAKLRLELARADAFLAFKAADPKQTATVLEARVTETTSEEAWAVNTAKANLTKLKALLSSVQEAINAIKFLGRTGGY